MLHEKELREQLIENIVGSNAHVTFDDAIEGLTTGDLGKIPPNVPYSIWQLIEHIRITQWDIVEFSISRSHKSPEWPKGYWPKEVNPRNTEEWENSIDAIKQDRQRFVNLLRDDTHSLYKPFPWGDGQNLLREALLIIDHTSYHTGEIIVVRRLLNIWR
jgi:hypothetical protein